MGFLLGDAFRDDRSPDAVDPPPAATQGHHLHWREDRHGEVEVRITDPAPGMTALASTDDELVLTLTPGVHVVLRRGRHARADLQYAYLQRLIHTINAARRLVNHPDTLPPPGMGHADR